MIAPISLTDITTDQRLNGFGAYCLVHSIKHHFTKQTYDFFKYHGKTFLTQYDYDKSKDKHFYDRLAKKYTHDRIVDLMLGHFTSTTTTEKIWVGDLLKDERCVERADHFRRWKGSFGYLLEQDLNRIGKRTPEVWCLGLEMGRIDFITFAAVNIHSNIVRVRANCTDMFWEPIALRITKFRPFFEKCFVLKNIPDMITKYKTNELFDMN